MVVTVVRRHHDAVALGDDVGHRHPGTQIGTGRDRRVHQRRVQIGSVGHEVRTAIPRPKLRAQIHLRQRLGCHRVAEHDILRLEPVGEHLLEQPPRLENPCAVRSDLQARAHFTELVRALEQADRRALAGQRERGGRAADSAAGDDHVRSVEF